MKRLWGVIIIFVLVVVVCVWLFLTTGGIGLVRLYQNYLSQDIPDKKYNWQDFADRGPREMLSGYYGGSVGNKIYVWTLSGLKYFVHQQGTSVYHYMDTCGIILQLAQQKERGDVIDLADSYTPETMFELAQWVKRVGEGDNATIIDKVWANSNQYYPVEKQLKPEQCQN